MVSHIDIAPVLDLVDAGSLEALGTEMLAVWALSGTLSGTLSGGSISDHRRGGCKIVGRSVHWLRR